MNKKILIIIVSIYLFMNNAFADKSIIAEPLDEIVTLGKMVENGLYIFILFLGVALNYFFLRRYFKKKKENEKVSKVKLFIIIGLLNLILFIIYSVIEWRSNCLCGGTVGV